MVTVVPQSVVLLGPANVDAPAIRGAVGRDWVASEPQANAAKHWFQLRDEDGAHITVRRMKDA